MFYFGDPGPGVRAALEMVEELAAAGLPPAHVGLHAGPVLYQEGDEGIAFADIGPVELKGVTGTEHLLRAHRT